MGQLGHVDAVEDAASSLEGRDDFGDRRPSGIAADLDATAAAGERARVAEPVELANDLDQMLLRDPVGTGNLLAVDRLRTAAR